MKIIARNLTTLSRVVLVLSVMGAYACSSSLIDIQRDFDTSYAMRNANQKTLISLLDAETSQRGYILTGKESYLVSYYKGIAVIPESIDTYERLSLDPEQKRFFDRLRPMLQEKLNEMSATIEERRNQGFRAAQRTISTDQGKTLMDTVRECLDYEAQRAQAARVQLSQDMIQMIQGVVCSVVLGIISILISWCGYRSNRKLKREIAAEQAALGLLKP